MKEIIFAKTRWHYDSYTDFWRLVELSGFPTVFVDEIDLTRDAIYIISPMNGEVHDTFGNGNIERNAKILLWNLERPGATDGLSGYAVGASNYKRYFDKVLVSDLALEQACNRIIGEDYFHYTTLGIHEGFGVYGAFEDKKYDLIHLCCYSNHRSRLFVSPSVQRNTLYNCSVAQNGWGDERHRALQASRFMFNWHQDEYGFIEPLRFVMAAAYGLPIITETCYNVYPYITGADVYEIDRMEDVNTFAKLYDHKWYDCGVSFRDRMLVNCQFRECIVKSLEIL